MCPQITLQNRVVLQKVKLSLYVQPPLVSTCDQFTFDFAGGLLCVLVFSAARAFSAVPFIHGCISFLNRIRLYPLTVESLEGLASDRGVLKDPQLCLAFVLKMSVE